MKTESKLARESSLESLYRLESAMVKLIVRLYGYYDLFSTDKMRFEKIRKDLKELELLRGGIDESNLQ